MALLKYFGLGRMWFNTPVPVSVPTEKDGEQPSTPNEEKDNEHSPDQ